jgi:hypothetical protein
MAYNSSVKNETVQILKNPELAKKTGALSRGGLKK